MALDNTARSDSRLWLRTRVSRSAVTYRSSSLHSCFASPWKRWGEIGVFRGFKTSSLQRGVIVALIAYIIAISSAHFLSSVSFAKETKSTGTYFSEDTSEDPFPRITGRTPSTRTPSSTPVPPANPAAPFLIDPQADSPALPVIPLPSESSEDRVQWKSLMRASLFYLGVMHSFRLATEAGTRAGLHNSVFGGYFKALGAMHGWSDGDSYYENYLGHPLEGAVSGYIWVHNDPRYRAVQFGADRDYWMSRLRAYAFAWAFSEQFEIGLMSEASIGQIQRYCCAYGFVDHVITPNGGLVWMLAGDAVDRYVTVPIENRTRNTILRIFARTILNPPQTFANVMMLQKPWSRDNRGTTRRYQGQMYLRPSQTLFESVRTADTPSDPGTVPKLEIAASVPSFQRSGNLGCLGGGAVAGVRATDFWQWTMEVSGCTLGNSLPHYSSGDSLTFTTGPQWIVHTAGKWSPHAYFRIGGQKITKEKVDPKKRQEMLSQRHAGTQIDRDLFTQHWESTGISLSLGGGLDIAVNRAMALRVVNFEYLHSWMGKINGTDFNQGLRFSAGLVLRVGSW